ncbi:MAG: long-chain fatty acid--CoA ligase [Chloroflexi bacterium]|nr:long-chain fatty acid--CoA ligase [Chloroflexota bacterium]
MIDFLLKVFETNGAREAIVWRERAYSYTWLLARVAFWRARIQAEQVAPGTVALIEADFSPNAVALFLALLDAQCILVPLTSSVAAKRDEFIAIAQGQVTFQIAADDAVTVARLPYAGEHALYAILRERRHPGLILFSSGSTGKNKAAVHDMAGILDKFRVPRHQQRAIPFLLYDHIGGVNTMLYTLSNGGCLVTAASRAPDDVLAAIEKYRVELLPTSPTFINLILLSEAYARHDLSSLKSVTYGTEPMPESTLKRFHELFPAIQLAQTYGLSEVGILRAKSKSSDSLWVKIGGEGFETRIVDGILHIKARSAMLGYLNAPSPFTADGWFNTNDAVIVDGEYMRILGRVSEIINVGGEKVYPAEIESVIQEIENIAEVTVYGEKNPIMGNIVCARVRIAREEEPRQVVTRVKRYCAEKLQRFQVPVKVIVASEEQYSERFKKKRAQV